MRPIFAALAAAFTLAGCQPAELAVSDAWVRLPVVAGRPGAAYFTVRGGGEATSVLAVSTPAAIHAELHEMKHEGGMMRMLPVKDIPVPAGGVVKLEPAGTHVMLHDISPSVRPGTKIPIRVAFANGKTVEAEAVVKAAGEAE